MDHKRRNPKVVDFGTAFKNRLKLRCLERVKRGRAQAFAQSRSKAVQDLSSLVDDEVTHMLTEDVASFTPTADQLSMLHILKGEVYVEVMTHLEEEMHREIEREQVSAILADVEKFEDDQVAHMLRHDSHEIPCFLCKQNVLRFDPVSGVVFCQCSDIMLLVSANNSLKDPRPAIFSLIKNELATHAETCRSEAEFHEIDRMLVIRCLSCNFSATIGPVVRGSQCEGSGDDMDMS